MKRIEIEQEDLPYTVVGHNAIPVPVQQILLTAEGIIELAKRVEPKDFVRIKNWADFTERGDKVRYFQSITIIRGEKL